MTTKTDDVLRHGEWAQLLRGVRYDYRAGKIIGDLRVADLAHSLAGINRYNAWTPVYWSVASHACLVAEIVASMGYYGDTTTLISLHHDDHESLTGDQVQPFKMAMTDATREDLAYHAQRADRAIWRALGIWSMVQAADSMEFMAVVRSADIAALEAERRWLMVPRLWWGTEDIVNPKMLDAGERILARGLAQITGGPGAAERYVRHHEALVTRIGVA